jgi:hypothetical protein
MTVTLGTTDFFGSEQQWLATLQVDALLPLTSRAYTINFDRFTGGDVQSTSVKHRPAGMGPEISYLSLPIFSDISLTKAYVTADEIQTVQQLHLIAGRAPCSVTITPLDANGVAFGTQRTYKGRLMTVRDGQTDSNSAQPRMWSVDVSVESVDG